MREKGRFCQYFFELIRMKINYQIKPRAMKIVTHFKTTWNENCAPNWLLTAMLPMAVLKFVTVSSHVVLKPVTIFITHGLFWLWNVFGARGEREWRRTSDLVFSRWRYVQWVGILSSLLEEQWQFAQVLALLENLCWFTKWRRSIKIVISEKVVSERYIICNLL